MSPRPVSGKSDVCFFLSLIKQIVTAHIETVAISATSANTERAITITIKDPSRPEYSRKKSDEYALWLCTHTNEYIHVLLDTPYPIFG